jgi:hypothetical protein
MAEETPDFQSQGHSFDPSPFMLDLYRLLCMVLADQRVSAWSRKSQPIYTLQSEYFRTEVTRILVSSAVALRIVFDNGPQEIYKKIKPDCGKLYPDWPMRKTKWDALPLREACNKIIHAEEIRFDLVSSDRGKPAGYAGTYARPYLYLYGKRSGHGWRAKLSIVDFARHATKALMFAHGLVGASH